MKPGSSPAGSSCVSTDLPGRLAATGCLSVNRSCCQSAVPTLLFDLRYSLLTVVLLGFGRAASEVGAVMIVGGNIDGVTRVMTTAIALETSKGDLPLALGLGLVLIVVVLALNAAAFALREWSLRRHG